VKPVGSSETQAWIRDRPGEGEDDGDAFSQRCRENQARLYSWVRRMIHREAEAIEVTQDVLIQAFRASHKYDPHRPFRPWLYKIALNTCRNHLRKAAQRECPADVSHDVGMWSTSPMTPEQTTGATETAHMLDRHLAVLTPNDSALLLLRYCEELSYAELKQVFGLPQTVLKMRVHRALKRLRDLVDGEGQ